MEKQNQPSTIFPISTDDSQNILKKPILKILKKVWPLLFVRSIIAISVAGVFLNVVQMSYVIFGDNTFYPFKMGLLVGSRRWAIAISGLVSGVLVDRVSRKKILGVSLAIASISALINGFSPAGTPTTYFYFLGCFLLMGISLGGIDPSYVSLSNDILTQEERSRFFGLLEAVRQLSSTIAMIFSAIFYQLGWWRSYYWICAGLLFIGMIVVSVKLHEPKRGMQSNTDLTAVLQNQETNYQYQLTKETFRSTILRPTNIFAFIEGIFTWLIFAIAIYMIYPYIQSPPYNISPVASAVLMIFFGIPGSVVGGLVFGRLSDKLGQKNILNRVNLIIISIFLLFFAILCVFLIPLEPFTPEQGNNIFYLLKFYQTWLLGLIMFTLRAVLGIYFINQNPIIQAINLPEAQGKVTAWGQLLETIANGLGPILVGAILTVNAGNYLQAAWITILMGLPGGFLWIAARRYIHKDVARIQSLLQARAKEMEKE